MDQTRTPDDLPDAPQELPLGDISPWALDPTVAHLNHGSYGAVTLQTQQLIEQRRREVESNPMRFYARDVYTAVDRATVAAEVFLGSPEGRVGLVENATQGTELVLRSIDWKPGDIAVTTDLGYPAQEAQVRQLGRTHGVEHRLVHIPIGATDDEIVEVVAAAAEGARIVIVDHVTSATGWVQPVDRLVAAIRATSARVLVDAAHTPGHLIVDLTTLDPNYWVGNFHKWACAPRGVAALYVSQKHSAQIPPLLPSADSEGGFPDNLRWRGTRDLGPLLVLPEVLQTASSFTNRSVYRRNADLARTGGRHVAAALGVAPVPLPDSNFALVPVPGLPGDEATKRMLQAALAEDLGVEVAVTLHDGDLYLRISVHVYVGEDDIDRLAMGVEPIVATLAKHLT